MQFDVYANPSVKSAGEYPYVVDIQSDLLSGLTTRMVAPLASITMAKADIPQRLCPIVSVAGRDFMFIPYQSAPLLKAQLKKRVASLRSSAQAIVDAMDVVISGI